VIFLLYDIVTRIKSRIKHKENYKNQLLHWRSYPQIKQNIERDLQAPSYMTTYADLKFDEILKKLDDIKYRLMYNH